MIRAAVIGHPVGHSLSPAIFDFLSKRLNVSLEYGRKDIPADDLAYAIKEFKRDHVGINVTLPHKEKILELAERVSEEAKNIGAANVVHFNCPKMMVHNTDVDGIIEAWKEHGIHLENQEVLLIGAGGAARSVAYAAGKINAKKVYILNRTLDTAKNISKNYKDKFKTQFTPVADWKKSNKPLSLIVNATPIGMESYDGPGKEFFDEILKNVGSFNSAFDLIYKPMRTPFLKAAQEVSNGKAKLIGGLDMLIYQALRTWEIWLGPVENRVALKNELFNELSEGYGPL